MLDALQYKVLVDMVYYRLGNLYFDSGDLARAEYAYMRAIETNPQHVNAHHNLSVVYKKTGRIHDSVRMRKRAARLEAGGLIGRKLAQATPPVFAKPVAGTPPGGMARRSRYRITFTRLPCLRSTSVVAVAAAGAATASTTTAVPAVQVASAATATTPSSWKHPTTNPFTRFATIPKGFAALAPGWL